MKKTYQITAVAAALLLAVSCVQDEVSPYKVEDSAIFFKSAELQFSLRYYDSPDPVIAVPVNLVGPAADYDRTILCRVEDSESNSAVEGTDFRIDSALVRAGELEGHIYIKVEALAESQKSTTIRLLNSDDFLYGFDANSVARITWTNGYTRPESFVWRSWFLLFSTYYSTAYHRVVCDCLGDEVDQYTHFSGGRNEGYSLKAITWWYAANRALREYVEKYDAEHPDAPLMHSEDVIHYLSQNADSGDGEKPERIPTIYETLLEF